MVNRRSARRRIYNVDGAFEIIPLKEQGSRYGDLYHQLLTMSWPKLLLSILGYYLTINAIFAALFFLCGSHALEGVSQNDALVRFVETYFFSVQTFATIGYGKVTPISLPANLLVTAEAFIGLLGLAVATGLVFSRFSKPTARVVFSEIAVVTVFERVPSLIFRIANRRLNQIVEAQVSATLSLMTMTAEGKAYRMNYDLSLLRSKSQVFVLSWTVIHPMDEKSPLFGLSPQDLEKRQAEVVVSLTGIDDTFSQTVHARYSYLPEEIRWNHKFKDMFVRDQDGETRIDLNLIHRLE